MANFMANLIGNNSLWVIVIHNALRTLCTTDCHSLRIFHGMEFALTHRVRFDESGVRNEEIPHDSESNLWPTAVYKGEGFPPADPWSSHASGCPYHPAARRTYRYRRYPIPTRMWCSRLSGIRMAMVSPSIAWTIPSK